jgi:Protein of unknown function (DUF3987)
MSALFTPTSECQDVPPDAVLPPGLEYELNMETGTQRARLPQNGHAPLDDLDRDYAEQEATANGGATQTATSWPEPVDIIGAPEMVGWPDLTRDCLPALLYTYLTSEAERLNVDACALSAHVLAAVSSVCSDAWHVKPKRHDCWTQQPRLWVCVVKDVGQRGTEMIRSAFWPVAKIEDELREQWQRKMAEWVERQEQRKKGDPPDPKPHLPRLTTQDATIEAASQILANGNKYSKLTYKSDELVTFLGAAGRYTAKGDAARALWLEGYDGGPQHIDRVIRGNVYVPNWSIGVAGNIQPRRLAGMARDLIDDGMFQRFLTVHTKPSTPCTDDDQPLDANAGHDYADLIRAIRNLMPAKNAQGEYAAVYFDDEARAARRAFMPLIDRLKHDNSLPIIIRETAPKWSGLLARLALIVHIVDLAERQMNGENLDSATVCRLSVRTVTTAATYIRRIVLPNLFRLGYETMPEEGLSAAHVRWIAGYILAHKSEQIRAREIGRAYNALRGKPQEIAEIMGVLVDAGWVMETDTRADSLCWRVNPAVHGRFKAAAEAEKQRREAVRELIRKKVSEL